ncbi:MAG TPA: bL35 family ribosomal protein [Candidatus Paceibacterota bacterium]|nr:bL35 family ribosomal protein [Candidatus Paceibacterota bacterium]
MKSNKSYLKRIKVTKNGKLKVRKAGQNHFNAKEGRSNQLNKKRSSSFVMTEKSQSRFLGGTR